MAKSRKSKPPLSLDSFSLWDHQRQAVEAATGYLDVYRQGRTRGSALIHLPTGTGKSGVIAVLARSVPKVGGVLVITPRVALREQLADDVNGRFFRRLEKTVDPATLPKRVATLRSKPKNTNVFRPKETVFLATIQSLHSWFRKGDDIFKVFRDHLDLVLIDEGHCEPAAEWSETIRNLPQPKILFTATPYRNDLKLFDIDYTHSFGISFEEAVEERFIRSVEILPFDAHGSPDQFVDQILKEYDTRFKAKRIAKGQEPRVIIRCEASDRIRLILAALEARGRACVGIHETFKDDPKNPRERKTVPKTEDEKAIFWVHQFKLLEGIDDPRFRMLAIFDRFTNTRELIQQVGRVLRNPGRKASQIAYLLDHSGGHHHRLWSSYLAHDRELRAKGIDATLMPGQKLFESLLGGQPASIYVDGIFRQPLDPASIDLLEDLQVPASANVLAREGPLQCGAIIQAIEKRCTERDLSIVGSWTPDARTCIVLYVVVENSPYLRNSHFLETRLAITLIREAGGFAFVLDTGGALPDALPGLGDPVKQKQLRRLFKSDQRTRLTHVSIRNSNLAADVVRARAVSAFSIGAIVPYADDNSSVCTRVEGVTLHRPGKTSTASGDPRAVRRYLGFRNARVSDYSGGLVSMSDYFSWIDDISAVLASKAPVLREFARYADDSDAPGDCTPVHVLLDLTEILDRYETSNHPAVGSGVPMDVPDLCTPVAAMGKGAGSFSIEANGASFEATILYDEQRAKYEISCSDLDSY